MPEEESRKRKRLRQERLTRLKRFRDLTALAVVLAGLVYVFDPTRPPWLLPMLLLLGIALNLQVFARAAAQEKRGLMWGSIIISIVLTAALGWIILLA